MRQQAFSLIELLVVITIIAILAGMLLPSIKMINESAISSKCRNHLRQCGVGMQAAAVDQSGVFTCFTFTFSTGSERPWARLLREAGLLEMPAVASCPSLKPYFSDSLQYNSFGLRWVNGYGTKFSFSEPATASYSADFARYFRLSQAPNPSEFPILADTCGNDSTRPTTYHKQYSSWYLTGSSGISEGLVHFRHTEKLNLLFCDGHVQAVDRANLIKLITSEYNSSSVAMSGLDGAYNFINLN